MITTRLFAVLLLAAGVIPPAHAQTFKVLHTFTNGADGGGPIAGLIRDPAGNLYGTTGSGGAFSYGTVFMLDKTGKERVLHSFDAADGLEPEARLLRDPEGNLYGTTWDGGTPEGGGCTHGCGAVFQVDKAGNEKVLYGFTGRADGSNPVAGLVRTSDGTLYGTTLEGGFNSQYPCAPYGCGVVFKVGPDGRETVLYTFMGGVDGGYPWGDLILDAAGNLYGTTYSGGDSCESYGGCGVIFKIDSTGAETVLYTFAGGPDGGVPFGGLIRDANGNLYGTTADNGGFSLGDGNCCGTVFKLDPSGKETVLYSFTGKADGGYPQAKLTRDAAGNLYGTTASGGDLSACDGGGCGTVFKLEPSGSETVLYAFTGGADGSNPVGNLARDSSGNLYGVTKNGGDLSVYCGQLGCGVAFVITP